MDGCTEVEVVCVQYKAKRTRNADVGTCHRRVWQKCYGVEVENPIDDWHCRRCQFALDRKTELPEADAEAADGAVSSLPPVHEPLEPSHKYHALHTESDFATVFQFFKRFRRMGLKIAMDATITVRRSFVRLAATHALMVI